ncbi:hypothetical protein ACFVZL_39840 [Streptomyces sp. NPDC058320]|uniref:hypothetical protein n=1 Tax=unclassified Streptomyces TaxID=2593676 RepID=UPI003644ABCB
MSETVKPGLGAGRTRRPTKSPESMDIWPARTAEVVAAVAGAAYGVWAAAVHNTGAITFVVVALGVVSGVVLAVLIVLLHRAGPSLSAGPRAALWAGLAGAAVAFLRSLAPSGAGVAFGFLLGLIVASGTFVAAYYRYYTSRG